MSNNQAISWCHLNIKRAAAAVVESTTTETLKYLISKWSYSFAKYVIIESDLKTRNLKSLYI
jgi:hypothetical protein